MKTYPRFFQIVIGLLLIAILASCLYLPFLSSSIIFDDRSFFIGLSVYDYAQVPFSLQPRQFPYFTLGLVQVLYGTIEANRIVSLLLHFACAYLLCMLIGLFVKDATQIQASNYERSEHSQSNLRIQIVSIVSALWFALNPVAVYGAAYLAQRTILFATLFSILCLWFYRRAFARRQLSDIFTAALFYSAAVFSKEHAIMLPLAAIALTSLYPGNFQFHYKRILLFIALCTPAAFTVFFAAKSVVATGYEPDVGAMIPRMQNISLMAKPLGQWFVSMVMQAGFFFDYFAFWIVPNVRVLSADMRFDFVHIWFSWWSFPKAFLFLLSPILTLYFLRRKGLVALFCCGFLYSWFLFLTELAAVRFQEPFVLYRSYLWAPGYVMMIAAISARVPHRWLIAGSIPLFLVFFLLARDRLTSLENEANVWKDAAIKLASPSLIGSDRIFYNRGRAYLQEKEYSKAIDDFSLVIQMSPKISQAYYNRAIALYAIKKDSEALQDLNFAASINQKDSLIPYLQGLIFERSACTLDANRAYSQSLILGNKMASMKLEALSKNNSQNGENISPAVKCPE